MPGFPSALSRLDASTANTARATVRGLLDAFFPWRCVGCGERADSSICGACRGRIRWIRGPRCVRCGIPFESGPSHPCGRCAARPPAFERMRAAAHYRAGDEDRDPLGTALRALKYGRRRALASTLGEILAEALPFAVDEHDRIAPVPLHRDRLRERGFNQAALLARPLARRTRAHLDLGLLVRTRPTPPQVGLGELERRRNLRDAFALRAGRSVRGLRVLLVDDVCTSGATADACARALLDAGAVKVDVVTLAHTRAH